MGSQASTSERSHRDGGFDFYEDSIAFAALSPREREVLGLLSEGFANAEIAERLGISDKTVRNHVSNLFDKLGVWTRAQAIVFARDRGFRSSERAQPSAKASSG